MLIQPSENRKQVIFLGKNTPQVARYTYPLILHAYAHDDNNNCDNTHTKNANTPILEVPLTRCCPHVVQHPERRKRRRRSARGKCHESLCAEHKTNKSQQNQQKSRRIDQETDERTNLHKRYACKQYMVHVRLLHSNPVREKVWFPENTIIGI